MQIQELAAKLQPLGLSEKESRVYIAALFLGPSSVQKISQQADVNRATAYVILDQLAALGLVSQSQQGKKTVFIAEPPESLERIFEHQRNVINEREKELKAILPELQQHERVTNDKAPVVRFYKGIDGVRSVSAENRRHARPNSTVYGMVNYDKAARLFPKVIKSAPASRLNKKISSKVIYSYSKGSIESDSKLLRDTKKSDQPIIADIALYEDRASFATYDQVVGIVIESKEIVAALRQLFDLAWKNQKK
jgi:sugar-specific transcriptional regulator TrmB